MRVDVASQFVLRRAAALLGGVMVLAAGATCVEPKLPSAPPGPSVSAVPSVTPTPSASTSATTSATATARSMAPIPLSTNSPPAEPLALRSATPGNVQCETVDCDAASEICCAEYGVGRCMDKSSAGTLPCGTEAAERHCDETADCDGGQRCCRSHDYDDACSGTERWTCTVGKCESMGDVSNERCLPRSTCATGECVV